jgi:hypothetical protein
MKIIVFIERRQTELIEKILRHCGLWEESPARAPPTEEETAAGGRSRHEDETGRPERVAQNVTGGSDVGLSLPLGKIRSFSTLPQGITAKILPGGGVGGPRRGESLCAPGFRMESCLSDRP